MRDLFIIVLAFFGAFVFIALIAAAYVLPSYYRVKDLKPQSIAHKRKAVGK